MNKENLKKYKEKLSGLSKEEKELRNKYLLGIATGKVQGPQVGYPSIDKPQYKYYRDVPVKDVKLDQSLYDAVFNQDDMDHEVIGYLGANLTLKDLKDKTDKCAAAFVKSGVKPGDNVLIGLSNCPEVIISVLALVKIGAVAKPIDLRTSPEIIKHYAEMSKCNKMIASKLIVPLIGHVIDETNIDKVLVVNPDDSLNEQEKINLIKSGSINPQLLVQLNSINIPEDDRFDTFTNFINSVSKEEIDNVKKVEFDPNRPSISIQSSGTTGKPKSILHPDKSVVQLSHSIAYSDLPFGKGTTALVALPPWIAYGIGDACLMPIILGGKIELCPGFDPDSVYNYIGKFSVCFAAPFHYRYLREHISELSKEKLEMLYSVDCMISGGDKVTEDENKDWEDTFKTPVVNGYGDNEGFGALSVNPCKANKYGTVGIPKYGETIVAYDSENDVELMYGEEGELIADIDTLFIGYENNPEETKRIKRVHSDGIEYLHTYDKGYIDSDGFVHYTGRISRVIRRLGWKISALNIEDKLSKSDLVKECIAVEVKDDVEEFVPMAFIVLNTETDNEEEIRNELLEFSKKSLKEYEIPKYFRFVKELPYTQNNKYDFRTLERIGNEFVYELSSSSGKQRKREK